MYYFHLTLEAKFKLVDIKHSGKLETNQNQMNILITVEVERVPS